VTVIVPVRDAGPILHQQLEALAGQRSGGGWEVRIADNGSVDGSPALTAAFADRLDIAVVRAGHRRGINVARNAAALHAGGDLLLFCDADDVVADGWVAEMVAAAAHHDVVGGWLEEERLNVGGRLRPRLPAADLPVGLGFLRFALGANLAVWRDVLLRLGGFDERFPIGWDDADFSFRAQLHGFSVGFAPRAVVAYRHRPTAAATFRQFRAYGRAEPLLYRRFRHSGMPRQDIAAVARRWASLACPPPIDRWVYRAGYSLGRAEGSARWRVRYL
jgi:GT2 family glycosyltransferase